jgi:hypothetical protein
VSHAELCAPPAVALIRARAHTASAHGRAQSAQQVVLSSLPSSQGAMPQRHQPSRHVSPIVKTEEKERCSKLTELTLTLTRSPPP